MKNIIYLLFALLLLMSCSDDDNNLIFLPTSTVLHDEAASVDLSGDHQSPSGPFLLQTTENIVIATQSGMPSDTDYFTIQVPNGQELIGITLTNYVAEPNNQAFFGIVSGNQFPENAANTTAATLLGGKVFGEGDLNQNILSDVGMLPGAQGFTGALPSGTYSIWLNQTGPTSTSTFSFSIQ